MHFFFITYTFTDLTKHFFTFLLAPKVPLHYITYAVILHFNVTMDFKFAILYTAILSTALQ